MAKKTTSTPKVDPQEAVKSAVATATATRKAKEATVVDPRAAQKKAEEERRKTSAKAALTLDIYNPAIVSQAQDLADQLEADKKELQDVHNIDSAATTMVDMVNAHNLLQQQLDEASNKAIEEREAAMTEVINTLQAQIDSKKTESAELRKVLDIEDKQYKDDLLKARKREQEEHDYNLKQTRAHEDDARKEAQAKEDAEIAARMAAVEARENAVAAKELEQKDLDTKLSEAKANAEEAYNKGKADGKKESDTSHAFETRYLNKEHEGEVKELKQQITALQAALEASNAQRDKAQLQAEESQKKLIEVMNNVALNAGKTTIVGGSDSASAGRK